jgi:ABC-type phosphate/phosphonate transport system substrate-binding protein
LDLTKDVKFLYQRNHDACLQQVLVGHAVICGTAQAVLRSFERRKKVRFHVVGETLGIPHILFAVHTRVPKSDRQIILQTILGWGKSDDGKRFLKMAGLKPFKPALNSDYDIVRTLKEKIK